MAAKLEGAAGVYSDLFVKLRQHSEFLRLCEKHGLDDPARWPTLRRRFVLNLANLQGDLLQAESMMEVQDRRSGLDDTLISSEDIRAKGRAKRDGLVPQMEELQQMLRLIDEMEAVLAEVSREHALTGEINIKNLSGQSITGQVLLVDGDHLIVQRGDTGYFRVPSKKLTAGTKREVLQQIITKWPELPEINADEAFNDEESGELVAYGEAWLYLVSDSGKLVLEQRTDSFFDFEPYQQQLDSVRATASTKTNRNDPKSDRVNILEDALALNQARLASIEWYEERLGLELTQREPE